MSFSVELSLRRLKPQRKAGPLLRRTDDQLPMLGEAVSGLGVLLDTCVYLDVLQKRLPANVRSLLSTRLNHHSAICVAELAHPFGRLNPEDRRTADALKELRKAISRLPARRLRPPSTRALAEAGMLAGLTVRLAGRAPDQALLNDAILFLQAREEGLTLLTRNLADFDLFDQLLPGSRLLLYRAATPVSPPD